MTDRELLELAAKAAGYDIVFSDGTCFRVDNEWCREWNPLTDDSGALRLAVARNLDVLTHVPRNEAPEIRVGGAVRRTTFQRVDGDRLSATRRAIVSAVAFASPD